MIRNDVTEVLLRAFHAAFKEISGFRRLQYNNWLNCYFAIIQQNKTSETEKFLRHFDITDDRRHCQKWIFDVLIQGFIIFYRESLVIRI